MAKKQTPSKKAAPRKAAPTLDAEILEGDALSEAIRADRERRAQACRVDIGKALAHHRCRMVPQLVLADGQQHADVIIIAEPTTEA